MCAGRDPARPPAPRPEGEQCWLPGRLRAVAIRRRGARESDPPTRGGRGISHLAALHGLGDHARRSRARRPGAWAAGPRPRSRPCSRELRGDRGPPMTHRCGCAPPSPQRPMWTRPSPSGEHRALDPAEHAPLFSREMVREVGRAVVVGARLKDQMIGRPLGSTAMQSPAVIGPEVVAIGLAHAEQSTPPSPWRSARAGSESAAAAPAPRTATCPRWTSGQRRAFAARA